MKCKCRELCRWRGFLFALVFAFVVVPPSHITLALRAPAASQSFSHSSQRSSFFTSSPQRTREPAVQSARCRAGGTDKTRHSSPPLAASEFAIWSYTCNCAKLVAVMAKIFFHCQCCWLFFLISGRIADSNLSPVAFSAVG